MTRIVAGAVGGRRLVVPDGSATRPTSERVREAVFAHLGHEGVLDGARVLDLYCGSGALGLEAASRGASHVVLVDAAPPAVRAARRNIETLGSRLDATLRVERARADAFLGVSPAQRYDLVLADPPYDLPDADLDAVLALLIAHAWLGEGAVVVLERSSRSPEPGWPVGLVRYDQRRYGETTVWLAELSVPEPAQERSRTDNAALGSSA